ncbi:tRNA dihydrouridine(16) synthase DusC [Ferrimonas sediminicola]|uniref:tRNA-dihydrouridine(16) synthase n=1 Tax=Ferrimonas sediminicola TaxID=2569538 RepID=A0A4U1BE39_9GAMM|nr:tRNA dihydrouridine(16) synthase DusC [Ferrimonas sediminicola]TKB49068.1 tRNA dihydrouridine(16) synthase DusC [Ferrimonas sediminicola]
MRVILAPMEGVMDPLMRQVFTEINDYDLCVTEFVRVVEQRLPEKVYRRLCPELEQGGQTLAGTEVRVQLLGQHPQWMAENAALAAELGSPGIDLNFGCPAKSVNRSHGGAVMLKNPEQIYQVVQSVRQAVPAHLPVTAKVRLGWDSGDRAMEIADAAASGGAAELVVHARTKEDGYRAERINWAAIAPIARALAIPVIANGEIWNRADALACLEQSGCQDIMLGRGALAVPNLAQVVRGTEAAYSWSQVVALMADYAMREIAGEKSIYFPNRIKQWLRYILMQYPQAEPFFVQLRVVRCVDAIVQLLQQEQARAAELELRGEPVF